VKKYREVRMGKAYEEKTVKPKAVQIERERTSSFFCELWLPWLAFAPPPKKLLISAGIIIVQPSPCIQSTIRT